MSLTAPRLHPSGDSRAGMSETGLNAGHTSSPRGLHLSGGCARHGLEGFRIGQRNQEGSYLPFRETGVNGSVGHAFGEQGQHDIRMQTVKTIHLWSSQAYRFQGISCISPRRKQAMHGMIVDRLFDIAPKSIRRDQSVG